MAIAVKDTPKILCIFSVCWLGGIVFGSLWSVLWLLCMGWIVVGACVLMRYRLTAWAGLTGIALFLLACMHVSGAWSSILSDRERLSVERAEKNGTLEGVVVAFPDVRRTGVNVTIETYTGARILVKTDRWTHVTYGDRVRVRGSLEVPEPFEGFAYDKYLAVNGVSMVMYRGSVETLGRDPPSLMLARLFTARTWFERRIRFLMAEPAGAFLEGLLLGSKAGLPEDVMTSFQKTGLVHIVALSGANITLIATILLNRLAGWVPRRVAFGTMLGGVVAFVLVTGAQPSLVRAAIMGVLVFWARELSRPSTTWASINTLLLAAVVMTLWQPLALLYDPGFQLSFAAMTGVLFVAPWTERVLQWVPERFLLRESVNLSVASQASTLPVVLWLFGETSWIAPLANAVVLPVLPYAMFFGAMAVVISVFSYELAHVSAVVARLVLEWALHATAVLSSFTDIL